LVCFTKTKRRVKAALERGKRIPGFGPGLPTFSRQSLYTLQQKELPKWKPFFFIQNLTHGN